MSAPAGDNGIAQRCPFCSARLQIVHVHGHGQCSRCGTNVDPCCSGASPGDEADQPAGTGAPIDPELFKHLFRDLGGEAATVTLDCVLATLARHLDVPLEEARLVLDAGLTLGQLEMSQGLVRLARTAR